MKLQLLIFLLTTIQLKAQIDLKFDKRFVECEDKWVAFKMDKDSAYIYGFIYIDEAAGLTFNREGTFKMKSNDSFEVEKLKDASIKIRLSPNNVRVAIIPNSLYKNLQIDAVPEWLKHYQTNLNSVSRLYRWGFLYNGWGECEKALDFLLKAYEMNADHKGLAVELAYSYNCLKDYNNALVVLEKAILQDSTNEYINKELIYTLIKTNAIDKAIQQYNQSVKNKIEATHHAENCFNILAYYYEQKDLKNFKIWKKELKKWPNNNEKIPEYVKLMEKELK
jgi:tetratricopeptide (TPR) repeat protein